MVSRFLALTLDPEEGQAAFEGTLTRETLAADLGISPHPDLCVFSERAAKPNPFRVGFTHIYGVR